jgi:hypothetical protein
VAIREMVLAKDHPDLVVSVNLLREIKEEAGNEQ